MKVKDRVILDVPVCQLALADDSGVNSNTASIGKSFMWETEQDWKAS